MPEGSVRPLRAALDPHHESQEAALLEIARLQRTVFTARGLDRAELRVTVKDRATIDLR